MMQVINQLYKLNCFNCAVGKIIIKNFIAHNLDIGEKMDAIQSIISERDGWIDVEVIQDGDGHWYVIPKSKRTLWDAHIQNIEREEDESDEWYTAIEAFDKEFGEHMTGGDINLIQLYIKQPKK